MDESKAHQTILRCLRRFLKRSWRPAGPGRYFAPDRDPYEVWLDRYERGLTIAQCDVFFATLRATIVPLLAAIRDHGAPIRTDFLDQDWPLDAQKKVSEKIMELWGLEPEHCE